jgi:hypothetical protein
MNDANHDALAHRFISRTLPETSSWPPTLQVALHELAFVAIPDEVLGLDSDEAIAWARRWRERIETSGSVVAEDMEWVVALAEQWQAARPSPSAGIATQGELDRVADLMSRLGPLALRLPWRSDRPAKA